MAFRPQTVSTSKQACPSSTPRTDRIALARRHGVISNACFRLLLRTNVDRAGQASDQVEKSRRKFWKISCYFSVYFHWVGKKGTIGVEMAECLEVHKSLILMALPTGVEPVSSD